MRAALFLLLIAGCSGGGADPAGHSGTPPPEKYVKATEKFIDSRFRQEVRKARILRWGERWEPNPAQTRIMRKRGGDLWLPPGTSNLTRKSPMPAVAFAIEVTVKTWSEGSPEYANENATLLVFDEDAELIGLGLVHAITAGWVAKIPTDPEREP